MAAHRQMATEKNIADAMRFRDVISERTDIEFVAQDDGSYIAFPLTDKGTAVLALYATAFATYKLAFEKARAMHLVWHCRIRLEQPPTPEEDLEQFRRMMADRSGEDVLVIAGGQVHFVGPEPADVSKALQRASRGFGPQLGHSGRGYRVKFLDGREIITHNLWDSSPVPPELRGDFPDNATIEEVR